MIRLAWAISSFFLILVIILQNPKAETLGGPGQIFGGTRATDEFINRITWGLALLFLVLTLCVSLSEL